MTVDLFRTQYALRSEPEALDAFCYVNEIPPFIDDELARLYGHVHSSRVFFETSRPTDDVNTYVAWTGGRVSALLVFRVWNGVADVLNEFITISGSEVRRFADYIFASFGGVRAIRFQAVQTAAEALPYPVQRHNSKENWVVDLPETPEEYTKQLAKSLRDRIGRYTRKTLKDYPSYRCDFYEREDIPEDCIRDLIKLSEARIRSKKKIFGIDEQETQRIIRLAKRCGMMNVTRIDGRLCAGMITYRVGSEYLAEVLAHDPDYNIYKLGTLCCHATICETIARGATKFHLGGGRQDYKAQFLAVCQDMDRLVIHRSPLHMALNAPLVAQTAADGCLRRAKLWLLANEKSAVTRSVFLSLSALERIRDCTGERAMPHPRECDGGAPP